jgi:hypothetical protein
MLSNFLTKGHSLTSRIVQTFAKFDRTRTHVNGTKWLIQWARSGTSTTARRR